VEHMRLIERCDLCAIEPVRLITGLRIHKSPL
jgi:hypothetical protein